MIKAIVVDDERLVRKGFISLFDWSSFGIAIVGEAGDGKAALELLEQVEVDLMFTDITMPRLSGFDLIAQVRRRFPKIRSVVLTCHHEFDYVQEALRLGAIDYIVKTLLEPESADEVMNRIVDRLGWEAGNRGDYAKEAPERLQASEALLFQPSSEDDNIGNELIKVPVVKRNPLIAVKHMWLVPLLHAASIDEINRELALHLSKRWRTVWITGLRDLPIEEVKGAIAESAADRIFYAGAAGPDEMPVLAYGDLLDAKPQQTKAELETTFSFDEAADLKWTLSASEWDTLLVKVETQRPSPAGFAKFGESLCEDWRGLLLQESEYAAMRSEIGRNKCWQEWQTWLRRFADHTRRRMVELSFSKEVMLCLIRAMRYMRQYSSGKLGQTDVADYAKMSRSYFSQCFAKFAGETFGVLLRRMRIDRAKTLLRETNTPVYEIATLVGFEDDKYFSKLFRELVGRLPSEYRSIDGGNAIG